MNCCSAACGWCGRCETDERMPRCATRGCDNRVTFDFDAFCGDCLQRQYLKATNRRERERTWLDELHHELDAAQASTEK